MKSSLENLVWHRAEYRCEYRQISQQFDELTFELDHIVAQKHRGKTAASNLSLVCFPCNKNKSSDLSGVDTSREASYVCSTRGEWDGIDISAGMARGANRHWTRHDRHA